MKRVFLLTALIVLVLTSQAFGLYSIMDHFAVETVLNKPEITSNMDAVKHADNVVAKENTVTYRSNFDNRIAVILMEIDDDIGLKGLSVRLQMPIEEKVTPHVYSTAKVKNASMDDAGQDFLKSLGYDVKDTRDNVVGDFPDEPTMGEKPVQRPGDEMPVSDGRAVDVGAPEPLDEEVSVMPMPVIDRDNVDAIDPVDISVVWVRSILLQKGNIMWTIVQYQSADGDGVEFILNIANAETISDEARKDFQKMLSFYGFDRNTLNELDENMSVMRSVDFALDSNINRDKFDLKSAMKTELEWLKANGIVVGITAQDINDISSISEAGMAGWNSRTVYSKGSWLPYYKTEDPLLIRILLEDAIAPGAVDTMEIPDGEVALPTASVSPTSKYITKWGKIKSGI